MPNISLWIKQSYDSKRVTATSVAAGTMKFLFGICDCTVDIYVGTGNFSLVLGILHECGLKSGQLAPIHHCLVQEP